MLVKLPLCDGSVPPGVWFPLAQAAEVALRCCCSGAMELPVSVPREVLSLSQHPQGAALSQGNLDRLSVKDVKLKREMCLVGIFSKRSLKKTKTEALS